MHRLVLVFLLLSASLTWTVGCAPALDVGAPCALASECPESLVCLLGRCRSECATNRDCRALGEGSMCLLDEASGARACRAAVEASCDSSADCGPLSCVGGTCVQTCQETEECAGTVCLTTDDVRACVEPTGGACADGSACTFGVCDRGYCDPVRALAAGGPLTCVLLESGRIACAGANQNTVLSRTAGEFVAVMAPVVDELGSQPPFESLDLGSRHACAVGAERLRCWGDGSLGQAGAYSPVPPIPTPFATLDGVIEVSAAIDVSCARTETAVYCFGTDQFGELGDALVRPDPFPSSASPVVVPLPSGRVRDVDVGGYHGCAVLEDGRLFCWGGNDYDQIGVASTAVCSYPPSPGIEYPCHQTPVAVPGFGPGAIVARSVALGQSHTCVLDELGAVYCLGANGQGQLGNGAPSATDHAMVRVFERGVAEVTAGRFFSCARLMNGEVACWGDNRRGELGTGGGSGGPPSFVEGFGRAVDLVSGFEHSCVLDDTGAVFCWGEATSGRMGDGNPATERDPIAVPLRVRMGPMGF